MSFGQTQSAIFPFRTFVRTNSKPRSTRIMATLDFQGVTPEVEGQEQDSKDDKLYEYMQNTVSLYGPYSIRNHHLDASYQYLLESTNTKKRTYLDPLD